MTSTPVSKVDASGKTITTYLTKVLVMGDTGVGKTSLVIRSVEGRFPDPETLKSTIGASFAVKKVQRDNKIYSLQLWDFAGQERFRAFMKSLFRGATAGIFVFDLTDPVTLDDLASFWIPSVEETLDTKFSPENPLSKNFILVGNKSDLVEDRAISIEEASAFAEKYGFQYIEVSSKTGENVDSIFEILTSNL
ncbi:MAG: Rab family GTPase [Candidatus Asgardarchaeia archaeon]